MGNIFLSGECFGEFCLFFREFHGKISRNTDTTPLSHFLTFLSKSVFEMNSLGPECNELKQKYDACFNLWFSEKFLKSGGSTSDSPKEEATPSMCEPIFVLYQKCVRVSWKMVLSLLSYMLLDWRGMGLNAESGGVLRKRVVAAVNALNSFPQNNTRFCV